VNPSEKERALLDSLEALTGTCERLLAKTEELELKALRYRGVWQSGEFRRGDMATLKGALWHCNEPTTDRPGTNSFWTLMHKSGS